jgi:hypothetical protein
VPFCLPVIGSRRWRASEEGDALAFQISFTLLPAMIAVVGLATILYAVTERTTREPAGAVYVPAGCGFPGFALPAVHVVVGWRGG